MPLSSRNYLLNKKDLLIARSVSSELIKLKKKLRIKKISKNFLINKKKSLENEFKIKIDYLELRKLKNLCKTSRILKSRFFIAYHIKANALLIIFNLKKNKRLPLKRKQNQLHQ